MKASRRRLLSGLIVGLLVVTAASTAGAGRQGAAAVELAMVSPLTGPL